MASGSRTSASTYDAARDPMLGSASGSWRQHTTTSAPASRKRRAMPEPTPRQPPVTTTTRPGRGTGASFVAFGTALTLLRSGARRRREPTLSRLLTHRQMRYLNTADTRSPVTPDKRVTIDE